MAKNKGNKLILLAGIMIVIVAISVLITYGMNDSQRSEPISSEKAASNAPETSIKTIVTSFYPMYIAALNLTDGVDGLKVSNLVNQQAGCAHDYQLTTADMKKLEKADMFIINGAGMESFVEDVAKNYKNIVIVDSSKNISLLEGEEHSHEEEAHVHEEDADHIHEEDVELTHSEDAHDHGAYNGHIWMDPNRYIMQLENITKGLIANDPAHAKQYEDNLAQYKQRIMKIWSQYETLGKSEAGPVIIFHDAMEYLMNSLSVEVASCIDIDAESSLSAGEIAEVIEEVKAHNIKVLFIEAQFDTNIANRIAEETGAKVYVLDTIVSGETSKDAYINGLTSNLKVIKEALYK